MLTSTEHKKRVLEHILTVWTTGDNQYLRLGQLLSNAGYGIDMFYVEDDSLLILLDEYLEKKKVAREKLKDYLPEKQREAEKNTRTTVPPYPQGFDPFTYSKGKNPNCNKCHGAGNYMYDHNHGAPCPDCCDHGMGYMFDEHLNGKKEYICYAGCGFSKKKLRKGEINLGTI